MLIIDGSQGEGGGQILRSSLALSMVTGQAFRMVNIRARRAKPGLRRQHLAAVQAAAAVSAATVEGAGVGALEISFRPHQVTGGAHRFSIGSAGSSTLVFQTVLPALMLAAGPSSLVLEGGTHNPKAPPFDFLARAFLPLIHRMGPDVGVTLERAGFYPAGGGRWRATIRPASTLAPLQLLDRGGVRSQRARALVAAVPPSIADRELRVIAERTGWSPACLHREILPDDQGPGNAVILEVDSDHVTEVFTGFGARGVPAETVAGRVAAEALAYLRAGVPVGVHLADQLLLPLALAGGGAFRSLAPSLHARTQADVIRAFLAMDIRMEHLTGDVWHFELARHG